jgi:hypothetical protein
MLDSSTRLSALPTVVAKPALERLCGEAPVVVGRGVAVGL